MHCHFHGLFKKLVVQKIRHDFFNVIFYIYYDVNYEIFQHQRISVPPKRWVFFCIFVRMIYLLYYSIRLKNLYCLFQNSLLKNGNIKLFVVPIEIKKPSVIHYYLLHVLTIHDLHIDKKKSYTKEIMKKILKNNQR